MGKPSLHKHIIQVWKKSKVLEYCIDCAFNMPIHTLKTRRVTKGRGELRKGLLMPSGRDDKRKHE